MPETPQPPTPTHRRTRRCRHTGRGSVRRRRRLLGGLLLLSGLCAAGTLAHLGRPAPGPVPMPAGDSHYGHALAPSHPLQQRFIEALAREPEGRPVEALPLQLRRHCAWGRPGGNPYRGTVEEALQAAALPAEVVQAIAQQVRSGQVREPLEISNAGIRATVSGRRFEARGFAMTYGRTLCLATKVNFRPGHVEPAALYEANDAQGRRHAVMVPRVCGNVSVIGELADPGPRAPEGLAAGSPLPSQLMVTPTGWFSGDGGGGGTRQVPEPASLTLSALALALLAVARRRRRPT